MPACEYASARTLAFLLLNVACSVRVHAIIKRTFGYAVRWKWITDNPARFAKAPAVTAEHADPTSPAEAIRLLAAAEEHSMVMTINPDTISD